MKKISIILFLAISIFAFNSCAENDDTPAITKINYVGFEAGFVIGVDPSGTLVQEIRIATSTVSSSERTFSISVSADLTSASESTYTVPVSVTVPANSNLGVFSITVEGASIDPEGDTLGLEFTSSDDIFIGEPLVLTLKQVCPNPELFLDITFDDFPEEQYWQLYDANDVLLYEGGTYPDQTTYTRAFCLSPGSYQFLMGDTYGDGGGPYTLTYNGDILYSSDGGFGTGEVIPITLQ